MPNEPDTNAQFSKLAEGRSKIYGLLSSIYLKIPDRDFVKKIIYRNLNNHLSYLSRVDDFPKEIKDGAKIVEKFIAKYKKGSLEELKDDLSVEYTRLFRGVKRSYGPPPPYESVYVNRGLVMDESTAEVKKKYAEACVSLVDDLKGEPPDHIGFELDFMRHLCSEESEAWEKGRHDIALKNLAMESRFIREHLIKWIPKFCYTIVNDARLDFYRGMAKMTRGFIVFEDDKIDAFIDLAKQSSGLA